MATGVRPYLTADPGAVTVSGWRLQVGDDWIVLPEVLPDWDYNTDLRIRCTAQVDVPDVRTSAALADGAELRWVVSWRSVDGKVGGLALRTTSIDTDEPAPLATTLPGELLGPVIDLHTRLVLANNFPAGGAGAATRAGSILWERVERITLMGELARFPITVIDFESAGLDPDASWVLDIPSDPATPVMGGLLLLVNARDEALVKVLNRPEQPLTAQLAEAVALRLLEHAVAIRAELVAADWDDGSLGRDLVLLAERHEGGLPALGALKEGNPTAFQAVLQGIVRRSGLGRPA